MQVSRRGFLNRSLAMAEAAGAASFGLPRASLAAASDVPEELVAHPPAGFTPLVRPGVVVRIESRAPVASLMQTNQLWPKPEPAKALLEAALAELAGEPNLSRAMRRFVHPSDQVAIKVNGIAGQAMATNFELILPLVHAIVDSGVSPDRVAVYEQYMNFLSGTRVGLRAWRLPDGVRSGVHNNSQASMKPIMVCEPIPTRYVRFLTDATAIVSVSLIKDHSICGYTGGLKNMTHGSIVNPHDHHRRQANPQIAVLYAHPILKSRMRLHIADGFKMIYDEGPLDKNPQRRILHGAVHAATDPVALDTIGAELVDEARTAAGLPTLTRVGRAPKYLQSAGQLGLGVADRGQIQLKKSKV
jgi:uncharacterized protein (DUF362 family)